MRVSILTASRAASQPVRQQRALVRGEMDARQRACLSLHAAARRHSQRDPAVMGMWTVVALAAFLLAVRLLFWLVSQPGRARPKPQEEGGRQEGGQTLRITAIGRPN
jgi:hypothetical protein